MDCFGLSLLVCLFYLAGLRLRVNWYENKFTGALFEFVSLPVLLLLFILPLVAIIQFIQVKSKARLIPLTSILFLALAVYIITAFG